MKIKKEYILRILRDYLLNSSIHGLHYLAEDDRSLAERVFWIIAVGFSCYGTYLLTSSSYDAYKHHSISFAAETDYLYWNTSFASVSICEVLRQDSDIPENYVKQNYPDKSEEYDFIGLVGNIAFYDGKACRECNSYCRINPKDCDLNFRKIVFDIIATCDQILSECQWNGQPFDCCSKFIQIETEKGICYSANSIYTKNQDPTMISNKDTGPGVLEFRMARPVKLYIHSQESIPYNDMHWDMIKISDDCSFLISIKELITDHYLRYEDPERKGCRMPNENPLKYFSHYSYTTCISECRADNQMQLCNCTHHMLPSSLDTACDASGLACLYKQHRVLSSYRTKDFTGKLGIVCDCAASCDEADINIVQKSCKKSSGLKSAVKIKLAALPVERLKRNAIRSKLDLVVSVGGTAGLFLGASLLSGVEILMFFCIRSFSNKYKY